MLPDEFHETDDRVLSHLCHIIPTKIDWIHQRFSEKEKFSINFTFRSILIPNFSSIFPMTLSLQLA